MHLKIFIAGANFRSLIVLVLFLLAMKCKTFFSPKNALNSARQLLAVNFHTHRTTKCYKNGISRVFLSAIDALRSFWKPRFKTSSNSTAFLFSTWTRWRKFRLFASPASRFAYSRPSEHRDEIWKLITKGNSKTLLRNSIAKKAGLQAFKKGVAEKTTFRRKRGNYRAVKIWFSKVRFISFQPLRIS